MASNYSGIAQYLAILSLMTDADSPSAATFRVPLERLLDNDVFLNAQNNTRKAVQDRLFANAMLNLTGRRPDFEGYIPTDTGETCAAISCTQNAATGQILIVKGDRSVTLGDGDYVVPGAGAMASVTSTVMGAARNGSRVLVVGTGGNNNAFTTNEGTSWSAGGAIGGACAGIIYNPTFSRFQVSRASTNSASHSADGVAWTAVATSLSVGAQSKPAMLANGTVVVCGSDSGLGVGFTKSTNGGTSWADAAGTVPGHGGYGEPGDVAGNGGTKIFHVGRVAGVTTVCSSTDGDTWTVIKQESWGGAGTATVPQIVMCQDTGIIFVMQPIGSSSMNGYICSLDGGVTWLGPRYGQVEPASFGNIQAAGGRLIRSINSQYFTSDGVGWTVPS